jgi:CRP/FNR family cyclic AMP-dependent transcriptional regulator
MSRDTKRDLLSNVKLFAGCSDRELKEIESLLDEVSVRAGRQLISEGQVGTEAYVIVEGRATATLAGAEVGTLGPGDAVGEMALLDPESPRSATVTADTDMDLLVLEPRAFSKLLAEHPRVTIQIAVSLAQRLRAVEHAPTF